MLKKLNVYNQTLSLYILSLISLFLIRFSLCLFYPKDFNDLTFFELISSFLMGLRIDIIVVNTFAGLIILLLIIPFSFVYKRKYRYFLGYFWFLLLAIILFASVADTIYFSFVHRHVSDELLAMQNDMMYIPELLFGAYLKETLLTILFLGSVFFAWNKILKTEVKRIKILRLKKVAIFFIVFILLFIGARGAVTSKPFNVADAYATNKFSSANLAINGFYSMYRSTAKEKHINYKPLKTEIAIKKIQELLVTKKTEFLNQQYPLIRRFKNPNKKHFNIVIVMLESWSAKFIDSFNANAGLKATPYFDKIANSGIKFTHFYANGERSIDGITAIFTGMVVPIGKTYLGRGLELSNLSYLGTIAKENNYSTLSMQSSKRGSFRIDSISRLAGFDEYFGAEDMPNVGNEDADKQPSFGTWDGNMFALLFDRIKKIKKPFLSFAFTSTTHIPFISPGKKWEIYPHNEKKVNGLLNTMRYSDEKLSEFMEKCKKEPWFKDTIFIFLADHTAGFGDDSNLLKGSNFKLQKRELEGYWIPLVLYAPHILKPHTVEMLSSQADLMPTVIDLLGFKNTFATVSNSLFDDADNRFVFIRDGSTYTMIKNNGYIKHNLKNILEKSGKDNFENDILAIDQVLFKLLSKNKIYN